MKFPLPDLQDTFSLKPGSLASALNLSGSSKSEKSESLTAAIAGARAAATQFSKSHNVQPTADEGGDGPISSRTSK